MQEQCEVCGSRGNEHSHPICQELQRVQEEWNGVRNWAVDGMERFKAVAPLEHRARLVRLDALARRLKKLAQVAKIFHDSKPVPLVINAVSDLRGRVDSHRSLFFPEASVTDWTRYIQDQTSEPPGN